MFEIIHGAALQSGLLLWLLTLSVWGPGMKLDQRLPWQSAGSFWGEQGRQKARLMEWTGSRNKPEAPTAFSFIIRFLQGLQSEREGVWELP